MAVTCYNAAATVGPAIESALAQDWRKLEVLVLDDASTDGSVEIVEAFEAIDSRLRLIRHRANTGVAAARNRLVDEAKGDFVAFFDDDDMSLPSRISRQYERIVRYEREFGVDAVVCHTARRQRFPNGYERYEATMGTADGPAPRAEAVADRALFGRLSRGVIGSCATCSQMARRDLYVRLGGFDPDLRRSEDSDFHIRLAMAGGSFAGIAEPLVVQTMTKGNEKNLEAEHDAAVRLFEKHRDYLRRGNWASFCGVWLDARLAYLTGKRGRFLILLAGLLLRHPVKFMRRVRWSLPARQTRGDFRKWHNAEFDARVSPGSQT